MQNKILTPTGAKIKIQKMMNVSQPTIRRALQGECNNTLAFKIRRLAIKLGGVELSENKDRKIRL